MRLTSEKPILMMVLLLVVAGSLAALPQKSQQKKDEQQQKQPPPAQAQPPAKEEEPAPLTTGKVTLKRSRQDKEVASAGFNGLDQGGHVDKNALSPSPTGSDQQKVAQLSAYRVDKDELDVFIKEGKLNPSTEPPPAAGKK